MPIQIKESTTLFLLNIIIYFLNRRDSNNYILKVHETKLYSILKKKIKEEGKNSSIFDIFNYSITLKYEFKMLKCLSILF